MKLLTSFFLMVARAQEEIEYAADSYEPYEYYALDQQLADLNVDSGEQGFGGELDTAELMPNDVQKSQELDKKEQRQKEREAASSQAQDVRNYANNSGSSSGTSSGTSSSSSGGGYGATGMTAPAAALKCWHCEADSYELCGQTGYEEPCHSNQEVCELVVRQRQGYITQIHMGCKQRQACENNRKSNFDNANPDYTQCRPEAGYTHSVCRQCCDTDNCTKEPTWWWPASRDEWSY